MVYHRNRRMHNVGNHGIGGFFHALMAPLATYLITQSAYAGWEPRKWMREQTLADGDKVVDLGCGVGFSTASLGVDVSHQMISMARIYHRNFDFVQGDIETWGETDAYDAASICFVTHEMPSFARRATVCNALRIARVVRVMDICPDYDPSPAMLSGEPYILDYKATMEADMQFVSSTTRRPVTRSTLVDAHVVVWTFM